jgi:hypothetical protein
VKRWVLSSESGDWQLSVRRKSHCLSPVASCPVLLCFPCLPWSERCWK